MNGVIRCAAVLEKLIDLQVMLPREVPSELPPLEQERTEAFWMEACKFEMQRRDNVSELLKEWIAEGSIANLPLLDSWLINLRIQWAQQLIAELLEKDSYPPYDLKQTLAWLLLDSWHTDGCIGLWMHGERGGQLP